MSAVFEEQGHLVYKTSRNCQNDHMTIQFDLTKSINPIIWDKINMSDVLILNATKTLDEHEDTWNTTLDTFDYSLLIDRINTNVVGYVNFVKQLLHFRQKSDLSKVLTIIYVDANESKCIGKMSDGKHLELNIAKAAVKQIFYTNANNFTKLNMNVMCYDPGWMSYHGVSIEKKRSNSKCLIPPNIVALGVLWVIGQSHQQIQDVTVYQFIDHINGIVN